MRRMMLSIWIVIAGCLPMVVGGVRRHLDQNEVARAVQLQGDGGGVRVVALQVDLSPSVVSRVRRRYQETGQYSRRQGRGHLHLTTPGVLEYSSILGN